jgi:hypothetical protein
VGGKKEYGSGDVGCIFIYRREGRLEEVQYQQKALNTLVFTKHTRKDIQHDIES